MRVVAGQLGGRRLAAPRGRDTRPTADRVREAVFSILGPLDGERVLDLFAGSGALGIEALSRGAGSAVFVDDATSAVRAVRENLDALGLSARVVRADAAQALRDAREAGDAYDLIFVDPPYRHAERWAGRLSELLPAVLASGGRVVSESDRRAPLALGLRLADERRYGDTLIRIHAHDS